MKKRDLAFPVFILLFLVLLVPALIPGTTRAEAVSLTLIGEDGRSSFHPGETVTITIEQLDSISSSTVRGRENLTLDSWSAIPEGFSTSFPAPSQEGRYTLTIEGKQGVKEKTITRSFRVEAFELYVFPGTELLISNQSRQEETTIYLELVDWKGEPMSGDVEVSITRSLLEVDAGEEAVDTRQLRVQGKAGFSFTPEPVTNSTLYHIKAGYMDYPVSECGVVVHPFSLFLEGERTVMEGGGSSINGPFFKREEVGVSVTTPGQIENITLKDIVTDSYQEYTFEGDQIRFTPGAASLYTLQLRAKLGNSSAQGLMTIPVNDWPITVGVAESARVGEELEVSVVRELGSFFAVRALLVNKDAIPVSAIMDITLKDSSDSPYYEKGLLNITGHEILSFMTPLNMREGEYRVVVGLGSWDEGDMSFHGMAFSDVTFTRPPVLGDVVLSFSGEPAPNTPFTLTMIDQDGNLVAGLTLEVDGIPVLANAAGTFTLSLPPGTYHLRVFSGDVVLLEDEIDIPPEPERGRGHGTVPVLGSVLVLVVFLVLVLRPE